MYVIVIHLYITLTNELIELFLLYEFSQTTFFQPIPLCKIEFNYISCLNSLSGPGIFSSKKYPKLKHF